MYQWPAAKTATQKRPVVAHQRVLSRFLAELSERSIPYSLNRLPFRCARSSFSPSPVRIRFRFVLKSDASAPSTL
jgi:hypothetical protein